MIPFPDKKYQIIYADPPWEMGTNQKNRCLVPDYSTMSYADIMRLPVVDASEEDCALFLWSVSARIPDACCLINYWGFRYIGIAFCWVKTSMKTGIPNCRMSGNYTLQGVELCLLGIKGKMTTKNRTVRQVVMSPREFHSKKPDIIRNNIVRLFGDLPRIELFARQETEGWDVWGNEVNLPRTGGKG